jgi:cytochrome d ubiquinol oxidase subunit I
VRWFYALAVATEPLAYVAVVAGWVTTEVGRRPWVVYQTMRTARAVTNAPGIPVGYGLMALLYLVLLAGVIWTLSRTPLSEGEALTEGEAS